MKPRKKTKLPKSPVELHNRFVNMYDRTVLFFLWSAILNLIGNSLNIINNNISFGLGYRFNELLFDALYVSMSSLTWFKVVVIIISLVTSVIFAVFTFYAKRAKLWALITGAVIYFIDTILAAIPFSGSIINRNTQFLTIGIHVIIMIPLIIAIFAYVNILTLSKQHPEIHDNSADS